MKTKELKKWLRDNSSGCYRPSAEAADYIENLETVIVEMVKHGNEPVSDEVWRDMQECHDLILSDNGELTHE